jgi:hypothetical protein
MRPAVLGWHSFPSSHQDTQLFFFASDERILFGSFFANVAGLDNLGSLSALKFSDSQ